MASWLVCSTPDRVVRVRALAVVIVLCSQAGHFSHLFMRFAGGSVSCLLWRGVRTARVDCTLKI